MRLPTITQFNNAINNISTQYDQISHLQTEIATGKVIQSGSDNPLLASRIKDAEDLVQYYKSFELNGILAQNRIALVNDRIQEGVGITGRVRELVLSAQNDTLSNNDRANIATELETHLASLVSIANAKDSDGNYIFSGMNVNTPAFINDNGVYSYQGSQDATVIPVGSGTNVVYNDSGAQIFAGIKMGNGAFSVSSDAQNNTGTGVISSGNISHSSNHVAEEYQITMVTNGSGQLAYQLVGTSSGQVIPRPPAISPEDAPAYHPGQDIVFNGLNVQITGQPNAGDVFRIEPSQTDNIFNLMQNIINTLSQPAWSEKEKANFHQLLGEQASSFNQAANHLQTYFTAVGSRGKMVDDFIDVSQNNLVDAQTASSQLSNADLGQVVSQLTQRLTTLEVAQQSYLKIQDTYFNLFSAR